MVKQNAIKVFEEKKVRTVWDSEREEWYFSIVDVVAVLTDSDNPRKYWSVLKTRLKKEGSETATNCSQLKLPAEDGKMRLTDVADTEQLFRLIQSIPSPKAEPFKLWMARWPMNGWIKCKTRSCQSSGHDGLQAVGYSDNWSINGSRVSRYART